MKITRVNAAKKMYSFNDLRDLESKLVLIRGRSPEGVAEIDRFLNVSISVMKNNYCVYYGILHPM